MTTMQITQAGNITWMRRLAAGIVLAAGLAATAAHIDTTAIQQNHAAHVRTHDHHAAGRFAPMVGDFIN